MQAVSALANPREREKTGLEPWPPPPHCTWWGWGGVRKEDKIGVKCSHSLYSPIFFSLFLTSCHEEEESLCRRDSALVWLEQGLERSSGSSEAHFCFEFSDHSAQGAASGKLSLT